MKMEEVPHILYREMGELMAHGDERAMRICGRQFRVRALTHAGAIGAAGDGDDAEFCLWRSIPAEGDALPAEPFLRVRIRPELTGEWACGSGRTFLPTLRALLPGHGIALRSDHSILQRAMLILSRAAALAKDTDAPVRFTEKDRNPEGEYTSAPHP